MTVDDDRRLYEEAGGGPAEPEVAAAWLVPDGSRLVIDHAVIADPRVLAYVLVARLAGDPLEHVVLQCLVRGAQSLAAEAARSRAEAFLPSAFAFAAPMTGEQRGRPP